MNLKFKIFKLWGKFLAFQCAFIGIVVPNLMTICLINIQGVDKLFTTLDFTLLVNVQKENFSY